MVENLIERLVIMNLNFRKMGGIIKREFFSRVFLISIFNNFKFSIFALPFVKLLFILFFMGVFLTDFAVSSVQAATKLYLQNEASADLGADEERKLITTAGSAVVTYTKTSVVGPVTPPTSATQFTQLAAGNTITWYSDPLAAITISGDITFNIWAAESKTNTNATITAELLKYKDSDGSLSVISSVVLSRVELLTAITLQNWTDNTPTSAVLENGDRLALRVYIDDLKL